MQLHSAYSVYKNDYIKLFASARISSPIASAASCVAFAWFPTFDSFDYCQLQFLYIYYLRY